jgi:anti-anti-sigma factor
MTQANISTSVRKPDPNYSIIDIQGEVTGFAEDNLMDAFYQASNGKTTTTILLNFTDLEYMNSSGIGLLVTMLIRSQRQKQSLVAYGLSKHYQEIFRSCSSNSWLSEGNNFQLTVVGIQLHRNIHQNGIAKIKISF